MSTRPDPRSSSSGGDYVIFAADHKGAQAPVLSECLQHEDTLIKRKTHGAGALQRCASHALHESIIHAPTLWEVYYG